MARLCIYPGSFDPLTNGHLDLIRRSVKTFSRVIVAIAVNSKKTPLFSTEKRVRMINKVLDDELDATERKRVKVDNFEGLLVDYALKKKANVIIRGLRAVSDFEYEFQMASMNRKLNPSVEMMFMMTDEANFYISSQTVKEVASLHGCIDGLVPKSIKKELIKKYGSRPIDQKKTPVKKTAKKRTVKKGKK